MMDIHTHILPGVDDGMQTYEIALDALKYQLKRGISHVVLTPHVNNAAQKVSSKAYPERFEAFQTQVSKDLPEMTLYLGYEVRYSSVINIDYEEFIFQGFNKKYLLIEFSTKSMDSIHDVIYDLTVKGFTPIIAHIERYLYLEMEEVVLMKSYGAQIQINSGAILGLDGKVIRKQALKYLKMGLVDYIASDCHNMDKRKPNLAEALKKVPKDFKMKELEGK